MPGDLELAVRRESKGGECHLDTDAAIAGSVDSGLIRMPRTTPSKGVSSGSRQLCQSSLRVPSPVYSDARLPFGPPSRRTTTQSAASASGTWSSAPSGCSEHWNRAATGGWIVTPLSCRTARRLGWASGQGQRQEYGRDSDGVECFPVHRLQYGNRRHRDGQ